MEVLLAGSLGALAVFVLGVIKEEWRRRRERNGLLRIVFAELTPNQRSADLLLFVFDAGDVARAETGASVSLKKMKTEAWEATRVKLAQRLSSKEFAVLADYYQIALSLKDFVADERTSDEALNTIHFMLRRLHERGNEVDRMIRSHVSDVIANELSEEDLKRLGYDKLFPSPPNLPGPENKAP